jgi:hypothetical protein
MADLKGLTGIHEFARGFVGAKIKYGQTLNGRPRVFFDIACGLTEEAHGKYPTWRHCVVYDVSALALKNLKPGDLVHCNGWVSTEYMLDEYYRPIVDANTDLPIKIEHLICYKAEIKDYVKKFNISQLSLGVDKLPVNK